MSCTGNNAETEPAKLGLTITGCDVCVCHKNRQLNQYSKAEPEWGHFRARLNDQKRLAKQETLLFFFFCFVCVCVCRSTRSFGDFATICGPTAFISSEQAASLQTHFSLSITKASRQLEITAPPSSKSFCHNLD